ncbi:MAG: UvrD-helicase domain-containing protein [Lachnospiraceae bacterium]|nr:UvrD-helicase domain-containing protein [Lachnospiraceae bacterium]
MSDLTSLEKDTESRNKIVSEIRKNFFVEAGAGSGKTTMLVSRMVAMVEDGIDIGDICAITFTKAAAGEFYDRFQKLLIKRSNPDYVWVDEGRAGQLPKPTDETRDLCAKALKNIDLCFMGTIDSFCSMVLSEHPSEARIPSDVSLISDEDAEIFYKQMYVRICAGDYGTGLASAAGTFRALHRNAEEVFVKGEQILMNNRNVTFKYPAPSVKDIDKDFASQKGDIVKALEVLSKHPEVISETNDGARKAKAAVGDIHKTLKRKWSTVFSNALYYLGILEGLRALPAGIEKYPEALSGLFTECGGRDKSYGINIAGKDGICTKLKKMQYSATMSFLVECVPILEAAMREKGKLTFFDYLYYLREMLKEDAGCGGKLIAYINNRHRYFLIDEFQDTNPMQAEVFFYLASENPVVKWSECVPRPGSLFIVGDPKQSIYRFRSADVASFLKVKGLFEKNGGEILTLSRNFRSTSVLCEHFNTCFSAMLPKETTDQSKFEEIPVPEAKDDEFQGVFTYTAYTASLEAEHPDETDPVQIAKIIQRLVGQDDIRLRGEKDEVPRPVRYSDIMVITYGKKKLSPIMRHLYDLGIPTRVEGQVPFDESEALCEVYRIYAAVADADDAISLYGALTGDLIGLSKKDMLKFSECGGRVSLKSEFDASSCSDRAACRVASKIEELKELRKAALKLSPAALFEKILDDYRVYRIARAENLEVVYYSLELMRSAERSGLVVSLEDGAGFLAELLSGESGQERCLSLNDGLDAVHMANLHKVKGLEAPIIILAAATKFNNSADIRVVHGDDGSTGYLFALSKENDEGARRGSYFETDEYEPEKTAETESGKAENDRLVYVAATRARNAMIVCDSYRAGSKGPYPQSAWKPVMAGKDFFSVYGEEESEEFGVDGDEEAEGLGVEGDDASEGAEVLDGAPDAESAGGPEGVGAGGDEEVESCGGAEVIECFGADDDKEAGGVLADDLYKEAEETCVLNDRSMEKATYSVVNPSRVHLSSKMAEDQAVIMADDKDAMVADDDETIGAPDGKANGTEYVGKSFAEFMAEEDEGKADTDDSYEAEEVRAADGEAAGVNGEAETVGTGDTVNSGSSKPGGHIFPALLGTMTHKLMEMIVSSGNKLYAEEAADEIVREYSTPTTEPYKKDLIRMLTDVASRMRSGGYEQTNGLPQDILGTLLSADEVYCEVPFCYVENGEEGRVVWNGIMDVLYCAQGKWHIVDYKTNAEGDDLDNKYRGQLTAYINAFKATTGFDADAKTYHIDI